MQGIQKLIWFDIPTRKLLSQSHHFESFENLVNRYGISVSQMTTQSFPHSWCITGFVARVTRRLPLVEQELITLPEHLSSSSVVSEVRVNRSLLFVQCFVDRCLSFCPFSFGYCVVCHSTYRFWLPLWYLQAFLWSYWKISMVIHTVK